MAGCPRLGPSTLVWWGIGLTASPLQNKGVDMIATQKCWAQMQLFVFMLAGTLATMGIMHWAGHL